MEEPKSMLKKLFSCFSPSLENERKLERDLVYCIAKTEYNSSNMVHFGLIETIYCTLTGSEGCPAIGYHWKKIGFQSDDPGRDFRATGMLGPLQVASLMKRHNGLVTEMYTFCNDPNFGYPLMVSQFGITRLSLEAFRSGKLNIHCNLRPSYIEVFDDFYCGATALFYEMYRQGGHTPASYGMVVQQFEEKLKNNPMEAIRKSQNMPMPIIRPSAL